MIRAGELRHTITIQELTGAIDAAGQPADTWTTYAARRAAVERTPGREVFASAQRGGRVPTVFRLRYLGGVTPAMRVSFGGKVYNILSAIDPDNGLREQLLISAEENVEGAP